MKINQLFTKKVDTEVLIKLLNCFGLNDLNDKRFFCKFDIVQLNSVQKLKEMTDELEEYYLPCKAKIYLDETNMNEKRAITVLKQVLRLHGYHLISKEKNVNNRKIIFYQLQNEKDRTQSHHMKKYDVTNIISFE
jgi:hypothetical protein